MTRPRHCGWTRRLCAALNAALLFSLLVRTGVPDRAHANSTQNAVRAEQPSLKPRLLDSKDLDWHVTAQTGLPLQRLNSTPLIAPAPDAARGSYLSGPHYYRPPPAN